MITDELRAEINELPDNLAIEAWANHFKVFPFDLIHEGLYPVKTEEGFKIPFDPFDIQSRMLSYMEECFVEDKPCWMIIPKARREGVSTCSELAVHAVSSQIDNTQALIIAHDDQGTDNIFEMTKFFHEELYYAFKPELKRDSKIQLFFTGNGSKIIVSKSGSRGIGRSFAFKLIHLSEFAYFAKGEDLMTAIMSTMPRNVFTLFIIESTGNGVGGKFYDLVKEAENGENFFKLFFFAWWAREKNTLEIPKGVNFKLQSSGRFGNEVSIHKKYSLTMEQMYWRREEIKRYGYNLKTFAQENPACFTGDTRASFPDDHGIIVFNQRTECSKGCADVLLIETSLGYSVKATKKHKFMTTDGTWTELQKLKTGDEIKLLPPIFNEGYRKVELIYDLPILNHKIKITEELSEFIGLYMGDGSLHKDKKRSNYTLSIIFDRQDDDVIKKYTNTVRNYFGSAQTRIIGKNSGGVELRANSKWLDVFFKSLELIKRFHGAIRRDVHVPSYIMQSKKSVVASFLRGLFDADGFISYDRPTVKFFTKYDSFMKDVQLLLLGFGITSKYTKVKKTNNEGKVYPGNELTLRKNETIKFMKDIGFISKRKNNKWKDRKRSKYENNTKEIKHSDIVKNITYSGIEEIYDKEVIPEHYYSANGLYAHNSLDECFQASGVNAFDIDDLNVVEADTREPYWQGNLREKNGKVVFEEDVNGWLYLWEKPDNLWDNRYNLVLDTGGKWGTSEKNGSDWNFMTVRDRLKKQFVAIFRIRAAAHIVADRTLLVGKYFDNCQVTIEINKWNTEIDAQGEPIVNYLRDNYSNIYHHKVWDKDIEEFTRKLGYFTTKPLKRSIVDRWDQYITDYKDSGEHLNVKIIAKELKTFVIKEKEGVYGAVEGERDDGVMSGGINLVTSDEMPQPRLKRKDEPVRREYNPQGIAGTL